MFNFLKIIYCTFYKWGCKYNYKKIPEFSALCWLSLFISFNIITAVNIICIHLWAAIWLKYMPGVTLGVDVIALLVFNIIFVNKHKYKKYLKEEINEYTKLNNIIAWVYIVSTFFLLFTSALIKF